MRASGLSVFASVVLGAAVGCSDTNATSASAASGSTTSGAGGDAATSSSQSTAAGPSGAGAGPTTGELVWSKLVPSAAVIGTKAGDHVVLAGTLGQPSDFGGGAIGLEGSLSIALAELDALGNHVWSRAFSGSGDAALVAGAVDREGNVAITGAFTGTLDLGGATLVAEGSDLFLAKLSPTGEPIWARSFAGAGDATFYGLHVASTAEGEIVFAGDFLDAPIDLGGNPLLSAGKADAFVAKFSTGGEHLWSKRWGGLDDDKIAGVVVGTGGLITVFGDYASPFALGPESLPDPDLSDLYLVQLEPGGNVRSAKGFAGPGRQLASSLAIDPSDNVTIVGSLRGSADFGGGPLTAAGASDEYDVVVASFDAAGQHRFSRVFGDERTQYGLAVAADAFGDVLVTTAVEGAVDFGHGALAGDDLDPAVAKLSPTGALLWAKRTVGADEQGATSVAIDGSGHPIVSVFFDGGELDFGSGPIGGDGATALVKLAP